MRGTVLYRASSHSHTCSTTSLIQVYMVVCRNCIELRGGWGGDESFECKAPTCGSGIDWIQFCKSMLSSWAIFCSEFYLSYMYVHRKCSHHKKFTES